MGVLYGAFSIISQLPGNEMLLLNILEYANENMLLVSGGIGVAATLLLVISYVASRHIYAKRDF